MEDYKITKTDLKLAKVEGKKEAYQYIYHLIKKGNTTGQICISIDVEINILNDLDDRLQDKKDEELSKEE